MTHIGLIPRPRLRHIPKALRPTHELCFFLHDECVRALKEYEEADAHIEKIEFKHVDHADKFAAMAEKTDAITALRALGYATEATTIVLNTIKMAMISDCLHHLYEALSCLEKRKSIVALNLLRKPLKDSLVYLAWMYSNPHEFYSEFTKGDPERLSGSMLGNKRRRIFSNAISRLENRTAFDVAALESIIFDRENPLGLEGYFQHAVHLVTTKYAATRTSPENFNFIFKDPTDDDVYDLIYACLPHPLLFLSHIIIELFDAMEAMDEGTKRAFRTRTLLAAGLVMDPDERATLRELEDAFRGQIFCTNCKAKPKMTHYNSVRIVMTESFRCTNCKRINSVPFSYFF